MKKILLVVAHPTLKTNSRINQSLSSAVENKVNTSRNLYEVYPDGIINVQTEQDLLLQHDVIIYQFPIFWYSAPYLFKKYLEEVFLPGFAYGRTDSDFKLAGKQVLFVVSLGAQKESYFPSLKKELLNSKGETYFSKHLMDLFKDNLPSALLFDYEQLANYTRMNYCPAFIVYGAPEVNLPWRITEHELDNKILEYQMLVDSLKYGEV
jgi:putative NADPH-quinone reductase